MKQIILHMYQSVDGCPVRSGKYFDATMGTSGFVLIGEETYLHIYLNHLGWLLAVKETLAMTDGRIDLTGRERVWFVIGDAAVEPQEIKANGEDTITAYGVETGALLLDNGLADKIVIITMPVLVGGGEKTLECGLSDSRTWIMWLSKISEDGKIRTVYGRVCP